MAWKLIGPERNICPPDFQARLTEIGGINKYDDPNFLIVWAQGGGPHATFTAGGTWTVDEASFTGYRQLLKGSNEPCWTLLQWHDAMEYGVPETYYVQYHDPETNLQILGEYPYSGRYEVLFNMRHREMVDGVLHFQMMPLSSFVLNTIVPILKDAKSISIAKKKAAYEDAKERAEAAKLSSIEQHMRDAALPFKGNTLSYTRQGIRTPAIDAKVQKMTEHWNAISKKVMGMKKGSSTSSTAL